MADKLERDWQPLLKDEIKGRFPECEIIRLSPNDNYQGIPDLLVLCPDGWGILETKRRPKSRRQPNQPYHVERLNKLRFAAFIDPDNMDEVLDDLQHALRAGG